MWDWWIPNAAIDADLRNFGGAAQKLQTIRSPTLEPNLGVVNADGGTGKEGRELGGRLS